MKKPTMRDIGKAAGVSAVTVSKALAGKTGMSDKVRRKILKIAENMGYEYPGAERLRQRSELDIGILIAAQYFETDSFYSDMYRKLVKSLSANSHFGLLEIVNPEAEEKLEMPNLVRSRHVDGLILLGQTSKEYYRFIAGSGIPVVFLDFYDEQASADSVVGDNTYGGYRLTSHLIKNGHTRIGFVGNSQATSSIMDRYLGYYRALLMHRLELRQEWIIPDRDDKGVFVPLKLPEELPTAFVCNCDLVAGEMIRLLKREGYRVPEDVSVIGFDDYGRDPRETPALSTFRVDTESMIDLAVKAISERCAGSKKPFGRTVVSGQPVYRQSDIILG